MEFTGAAVEYYKKPELSPERREFYRRLDGRHTAPLWEVMAKIIPPTPTPETVPACWRYDEVRPLLMEAGDLLTATEADTSLFRNRRPGIDVRQYDDYLARPRKRRRLNLVGARRRSPSMSPWSLVKRISVSSAKPASSSAARSSPIRASR